MGEPRSHRGYVAAPDLGGGLTRVFQDIDYTYDAVGNIVQIDDGAQDTEYFDNTQIDPTQKFTYDALYRLIEAEGREKTAMGQPLWDSYPTPDSGFKTLGAQNTLLARYTRTYTYDEVGNILTMSTGGSGWTRTYTYEEVSSVQVSNKLVSYTIPGAGGPAQLTYNDRGAMDSMHHTGAIVRDWRDQIRKITLGGEDGYYAYDAGGKRLRKWEKDGLEETFYLGGWELYIKDPSGTADDEEHETLHVMDDQRRVALVETCTKHKTLSTPHVVQRYQLDNHLGTALVELDEDAEVISYEEFHPYGTTAWWAEDTAVTARRKRYRYTGKERDEWTGMADHGARFYLCWLGRWESADPAGMVDGPNRYAYVRGNPVSGRDPSGLGSQGATWEGRSDAAPDPDGTSAGLSFRSHTVPPPKVALPLDAPTVQVPPWFSWSKGPHEHHRTNRNRVVAIAIGEELAAKQPDSHSARTLEALFRSDQIGDVGISDVSNSAEKRLQSVFALMRYGIAGALFGLDFGQEGFQERDPWLSSDNQVSHFLTAVELSYSPETQITGPRRHILGAPADEPIDVTAVRLIVGHELVADTPPESRNMLREVPNFRRQYQAATSEHVEAFLAGRLDDIPVTGVGEGNSRADLELSWKGYQFGQLLRAGAIATRKEAADWIAREVIRAP